MSHRSALSRTVGTNWHWIALAALERIPRASRTSKKVGPVKKNGVLEEEPGSSKPISYIWVLYGLNTGFVRFKG